MNSLDSNGNPNAVSPRNRRRAFLKYGIGLMAASPFAGGSYCLFEAKWLRTLRVTIPVPRLPTPFRGTTIALLSDIHHGPHTSLDYVRQVIARVNRLQPDLILMAGDYVHRGGQYIRPCLAAHGDLRAPLGVYGVLGNHDHWDGAEATKQAMRDHHITELTNTGIWLERAGARLRIAGVGDWWTDTQDLDRALADTDAKETAIVLSHNPDFVETIRDRRVGLVLSGHTHGGQVVLPIVGAPRVPSAYGQKYLRGLVRTSFTQVFVTRGLGTVTPPVRFCCRPELVLISVV